MIGDTLFDCGEELDGYLTNYRWPAEVERRVRRVRAEIRELQEWLDRSHHETLANVELSDAGIMEVNRFVQDMGMPRPPGDAAKDH
jgi:hypothetical protein